MMNALEEKTKEKTVKGKKNYYLVKSDVLGYAKRKGLINGRSKAHRYLDCIQCKYNIFFGYSDLLSDFLYCRLFLILLHIVFLSINCLVCSVSE